MSDAAAPLTLKEAITSALRYWEPRRIVYNAALAIVVGAYFIHRYPASKDALTLDSCLVFFVLAIAANICYSAVYIVEIFVQLSGFRETWLRFRWILLVIGIAFAAVFTRWMSIALFQIK